MKKFLILAIAVLLSINLTAQHTEESNGDDPFQLNDYNEKTLSEKLEKYSVPFGGFTNIGIGFSPSHPVFLVNGDFGLRYKLAEISTSAIFAAGGDKTNILLTTLGLRIPFNEIVTCTPLVGLYVNWTDFEPIDWSGGNHLTWGGKVSLRTANNLYLTTKFYDHRGYYSGRKQVLVGWDYIF